SSQRERKYAAAGGGSERRDVGENAAGNSRKVRRAAALQKKATRALLEIATNPGAEIVVDGKKRGRGGARMRLGAGWHRIQVRLGQVEKSRRVRLRAGARKVERIYFDKGRLKVVVHPYADIYINGRHAGQSPMAPLDLWEGTYELRLVNAELGKSETLKVQVKPGKTTPIVRDWR
ncbi:MAG: hypothetical protein D6806_15100, partial [Deltaproteobacteria bacterium]